MTDLRFQPGSIEQLRIDELRPYARNPRTHSDGQGSTIQEWNRESPGAAGYFSAGLAQRETLAAVSTTWKWRARAETSGTTVNVGNLAIAVLQLEATPAAVRRRYMALAG